MNPAERKALSVAVGVIRGADGRVLISKRKGSSHLSGLWEFPGGKLEAGEDVFTALCRELGEELNIVVTQAHPLIRIHHQYETFDVLLQVWCVDSFEGTASGHEGQEIAWVTQQDLPNYEFPPANLSIISAARLPKFYAIVEDADARVDVLLQRCLSLLNRDDCIVQLRAKYLAQSQYIDLADQLCKVAHSNGTTLLLNCEPQLARQLGASGVHLSSERLMQLDDRPLDRDFWVAASCHNQKELQHACNMELDFAVLSPVKATRSHPGVKSIGWDQFESWVENSNVPVFALGGLQINDLECAQAHGGQGIAGIRAFVEEGL